METVEYLMVCKDTDSQIIISKALMESFVNAYKRALRGERIILGLEDFLQTLYLLLTIRTDIDLVALQEIILEGLTQKFKVLMKERLSRDIKTQCGQR